jgi:hypothetical protein
MRDLARRAYQYGTYAMFVLIVVQFVAAGAGLFSVLAQDSNAAGILQYHRAIGPLLVGVVTVLSVVAAFVGRLPWRMTGLAASFFPLMVLQSLLIIPFAYPNDIPALGRMPWLASLHVANALFIFWLALQWPGWARDALDAVAGPELPGASPARASSLPHTSAGDKPC